MLGVAIGLVAMNYLKPIHDANLRPKLVIDHTKPTFDDEMRTITKKRIEVADHNHTIFLRMWEERCPKGLDKTQPVCANGPPEWVP